MTSQILILVCIVLLTTPYFVTTLAQLDNYIVHMDLSSMPKAFSSHHNWYLSTINSILDSNLATTMDTTSKYIYGYDNVIHGFSASLSPSELDAIKNSHGYVSSYKDRLVKADTTRTSQFLMLSPGEGLWPESEYGKDVIIGLVDTGIWPESASFNDDGMSEIPSRWKGGCQSGTQFNSSMCNKKLIGAKYFNKGLLAKFPNLTISMNSSRDTDGHGTHTSSTAAGNYVENANFFGYALGEAHGVAPRAHVAMYKALWEEGGYTSDILAAMDEAITDGVDVLSLSLGLDGVAMYEDPVAIASFAALEKGVFVTTSAGNGGPYLESLHNGTPWVITVAAGTIDRQFHGILTLGNKEMVTGMSLYPGDSIATLKPMVFMGACDNVTVLKKIVHKIVVCKDNNDSIISGQVYNVQNANVTGGIFITDNTNLEFLAESSFPTVFINFRDGAIVLEYMKNSTDPRVKVEFHRTSVGTQPAPRVASYSSRGPSPSCPFVLKPDLMAPGVLILAAWPKNTEVTEIDNNPLFSEFNIISGTSMSCPHVAGVAALLKGARPEWGPAFVRSAMMTSSYTNDNTDNPIQDLKDNKFATPLAIGAGHVDPNKALDPGLVYDVAIEDYVNLLCALNYTVAQIHTITRSSLYNCSSPSLDLNYPSFIAFFNSNNSKSGLNTTWEFRRTVTYIGEGIATFTANLTSMEGFIMNVKPNKLVFNGKNEKQSYKLSIQGPSLMNQTVAYSWLSWVEVNGKYIVKSPIVATSISSEAI